ncbi:Uncharacterised protein [Mycobacteroides abscessus subsp. abscessus]|uniref:hypothetical protein n=1 Tax=Mycobacteriaceae TaxID=1762 RepID=UPI0006B31EF3|nr:MULTISPECIES: hypothetical protein [Mycobacteriaceae]KAB7754416.1 hypothetical protein MMUC44124_21665 [Mycolicibacterium mucogenicum DSM 44124]SLE89946.1 Uncharacterised protein [Mycobacteroides abscessus subsp. abscessus]
MPNMVKTSTTLFAPKVRYSSTFDIHSDAMMAWRAEMELGYFDEDDDPGDATQVSGGHAEFVLVDVGADPIGELLDSLSPDAAYFSTLFEGVDVAPAVQQEFEDAPFNRILIVTRVEVAAPLRGHGLGAWLVAELVARMASPIDTLVLLYPNLAGPHADNVTEMAGAEALWSYWQRCGLAPLEHHPQFLAAATAYTHLLRARDVLRSVGDVRIAVPASLIRRESPEESQRMVITDPEPGGLRLVRD